MCIGNKIICVRILGIWLKAFQKHSDLKPWPGISSCNQNRARRPRPRMSFFLVRWTKYRKRNTKQQHRQLKPTRWRKWKRHFTDTGHRSVRRRHQNFRSKETKNFRKYHSERKISFFEHLSECLSNRMINEQIYSMDHSSTYLNLYQPYK